MDEATGSLAQQEPSESTEALTNLEEELDGHNKDSVEVASNQQDDSKAAAEQEVVDDLPDINEDSNNCNDAHDAAASKVERALQKLNFRNPGPRLLAASEEKRRSKRINNPGYLDKHKVVYDCFGHLVALDGLNVCDCLVEGCPGCHLPCPSCSSRKCGPECRVNRTSFYDYLEVDGTDITVRNPYFKDENKNAK